MTIKEMIKQIDTNLSNIYTELQKLKYEKEIENYIRRDLGGILISTQTMLNFLYDSEERQGEERIK